MGIDESLVQEIVRRILAVAAPQKIILFGSAAAGQMTRDSDIDIRYPGDQPAPSLEETLQAVDLARKVRDSVAAILSSAGSRGA